MAHYNYNLTPLAEGGEKVVHRGICIETGAEVAVKFLRRPYTAADRDRFAAEIARMGRAKVGAGDRITTVLDYNLDHDPPFYVEEYFADGTLAQKMAAIFYRGQVFNEGPALGYCRQILMALAGVHRSGQIHRDVKPSNVLVRAESKTLVLSDMGIGRTLARPTMLQTRMFVGTRGYAAPEQERGLPVDHRADIYPVGVILHEMLTGERGAHDHVAFRGDARIRQILTRLLGLNRNLRYQTAAEAADAITRTGLATR